MAPAQARPDHCIVPYHTHLKSIVGRFCNFNVLKNLYGSTLRYLLTLQALDSLRKDVLTSTE